MEIDACSFENSTAIAIEIINTNASKSEAIVTNSVSNNVGYFFRVKNT